MLLNQKQSLRFMVVPFLVFSFLVSSILIPVQKVSAETASIQATKTTSATTISTKDELEVKLDIKGTPPVSVVQPNDVMLIIDKSGSMMGDKVTAAKEAAKGFVDLMDFTKHRVGIVDFSFSMYTGTLPLTTDGQSVKSYIDTIQANGGTDTGYAIRAAMKALENHRSEAQPVILILTDGDANYPEDAKLAAQEAKDAGIVFYTVALLNATDNPDTSAPNLLLKEMATTAQHHHFVLGSTGLPEIYAAIVKEIGITSARDVVVTDVVSPEFEIVPGSYDQNIPKPTVSGNTLTWNFLELKDQTLTFTYKIRPKSQDVVGTFPISSGSTIQYKNYLGNTQSASIPALSVVIKYPKPDITAVTPDKSEITGGNEITIQGTDFRQGAKVTVNSAAATNVQVTSENEIKATVPTGTQGKAIVRVTNTDGQWDEQEHYYFANPVVATITPNKGLPGGGTKVAISGKYFLPGAKAFFNNIEAATTYSNAQYITAITPKSDYIGAVDVKVVNPDGTEVTVPNGFTYETLPAPTITSLSPNEGKLAGGDYVYIYGNNFQTGATVKVGGQDAKQIVLVEQTRIRIVTPVATNAGAADVVVTNPDGQNAILTGGYTYLATPTAAAPTITKLSQASGLLAGGDYVTIFGTGFQKGLTVTLGGVNATVANYYDATQIRIVIPQGSVEGAADIVITNPDNQVASLAGAYTYLPLPATPAPTITSLSKTTGLVIGGDYVTINGTGFQQGLTVKLGGLDAQIPNFYGATSFRIAIPKAASAGVVDLEITNPDGQKAFLSGAYTYTVPVVTITSLSPASGAFSGGSYIYIYGTNFNSGSVVTVNNVPVNITYYSATQIKINSMPSGDALGLPNTGGAVPINVTDSYGNSVSADFTYNAKPATSVPQITKLCGAGGAAATASITGGSYLYFYGTGFSSAMKVRIYDSANILVKEENITNFYRADYSRHLMPKVTTAGNYTVKLVNIDGAESNGMTFVYK